MGLIVFILLVLAFVFIVPGMLVYALLRSRQNRERPEYPIDRLAFWISYSTFTASGLTLAYLLRYGFSFYNGEFYWLPISAGFFGVGLFSAKKVNSKANASHPGFLILIGSAVPVMLIKFMAIFFAALAGGMGWGRPLRIRGKIVRPELREGDEWCAGEKPLASELDEKTRRALEALWLHDAQKEYASVPAFSRLTWQMISLGAPPEIIRDLHVAGLQEIDHTKKCFALAAGFGGTCKTVQPLPEILHGFDNVTGDAYVFLALDSLVDGCLLEGFNADTAEASAKICKDPVSLKVIKQIAREERFHADIAWRLLQFCFEGNPVAVGRALRKKMPELRKVERPTAVSTANQNLVAEACPQALIRYGRLPDSEFDFLWEQRLVLTEEKLNEVLSGRIQASPEESTPELLA